jgi:hypothetical protein
MITCEEISEKNPEISVIFFEIPACRQVCKQRAKVVLQSSHKRSYKCRSTNIIVHNARTILKN